MRTHTSGAYLPYAPTHLGFYVPRHLCTAGFYKPKAPEMRRHLRTLGVEHLRTLGVEYLHTLGVEYLRILSAYGARSPTYLERVWS